MSGYILDRPWKHKNWLVWPNATFTDINMKDCDDTVEGICYKDKTITECIDISQDHDSAMGYHLQLDDSSICVPIKTDNIPDLNPIYSMRNQNIYPEFDKIVSSTFINTEVFNFPPRRANVIYFNDTAVLKHVQTGLYLQRPSNENKLLTFGSKETAQTIVIVPKNISAIQFLNGKPVRYGDVITFSIAGTNLFPINHYGRLRWTRTAWINNGIVLKPEDATRDGKMVWFKEKIYVRFETTDYGIVENDILRVSIENMKDLFVLEPRTTGYYCDGKECKLISMDDTVIDKDTAHYKNMLVGRVPGCWGVCNYLVDGYKNEMLSFPDHPPGKKDITLIVLISISFILILSTIYLFLRNR